MQYSGTCAIVSMVPCPQGHSLHSYGFKPCLFLALHGTCLDPESCFVRPGKDLTSLRCCCEIQQMHPCWIQNNFSALNQNTAHLYSVCTHLYPISVSEEC